MESTTHMVFLMAWLQYHAAVRMFSMISAVRSSLDVWLALCSTSIGTWAAGSEPLCSGD